MCTHKVIITTNTEINLHLDIILHQSVHYMFVSPHLYDELRPVFWCNATCYQCMKASCCNLSANPCQNFIHFNEASLQCSYFKTVGNTGQSIQFLLIHQFHHPGNHYDESFQWYREKNFTLHSRSKFTKTLPAQLPCFYINNLLQWKLTHHLLSEPLAIPSVGFLWLVHKDTQIAIYIINSQSISIKYSPFPYTLPKWCDI